MKISTPKAGFTLVEIMIVVAIIGLLAAIAIPNFIKARQMSQKNACIANLKQLDGAIHTWALEKGKNSTHTAADADIFGPTLYVKIKPACPSGGAYTYQTVGATDGSIYCTLKGAEFHTLPGQ